MDRRKELALMWLDYAEIDLTTSRDSFSKGEAFFHVVLFNSQQAAEKALKSLLILHNLKFPRTHDLHVLLSLMEGQSFFESRLYLLIEPFDNFTVEVRYPDYKIELTSQDIIVVLDNCQLILDFVKNLIISK